MTTAPAPALSPDEINARMLERSTQQALARALPPRPYDLAWSALLDLVELRARKIFPDRFDRSALADTRPNPPAQPTEGVPHETVPDRPDRPRRL